MIDLDTVRNVATSASEPLCIPTDKLQFRDYHDPARSADVVQVFFREDAYNGNKYAFEVCIPDSGDHNKLLERVEEGIENMEATYLEHAGNVTFYEGKVFQWKMQPAPYAGVTIKCPACQERFSSPKLGENASDQLRDLVLLWLLADSKGECSCNTGNSSKSRMDIQVDEGAFLPRVN